MTIYDIAKEAGVAPSTVSRVLNNKNLINMKTREKVEAVIKKHNFIPNSLARGLTTKESKSIGLLTSDLRDIHFASIAVQIEKELSKYGYSDLLCNTSNDFHEKLKYIRLLAEKRIDGLILIGSAFNDIYVETALLDYLDNIPIVIANGTLNRKNVHSVIVDVKYGISLCLDHLKAKGHQNILFVTINERLFSSEQKLLGFKEKMKELGLKVSEDHIFACAPTPDGGYEVIDRILASKVEFTAIMFCNDLMAFGGANRLIELGYSIPKDIAITGFNNSNYSRFMVPTLTTVDNKYEMLSIFTTQLLIGLLEGKDVNSDLTIKPTLVVRQST